MESPFTLEENLKSLSEKEYFYSPLTREDFFYSMETDFCREEVDESAEEISAESVPLLVNEQNMQKILEIEQKSDPYQGRNNGVKEGCYIPPFYLYYEEAQFISFVQNNDIRSLCQKYRVVILVGEEEFENYFCQMDTVFPTVIRGDANKRIEGKITEIKTEREKILKELAVEVYWYYKQSGEAIKKRVIDGSAKICVLKYFYEPDGFQKSFRDMKRSLDKLGYDVSLCSERGNIFITNEILNLYQYRPDVVFQINKTRTGTYGGEEFVCLKQLDNLILISWIQDQYPTITSRQGAASLKKRDYIFSFYNERVMQKYYEYPERNVIYGGMMSADTEDFCKHPITAEEHKIYDCDICFMGSFFSEKRIISWIYDELSPYLTDEQMVKVYDGVEELAEGIYDKDTQKYTVGASIINRCLDKVCAKLQCDERVRLYLYKVFDYTRYQLLRKLIIQQLADSKKYKIIVYGSYLDIDGIEYRNWIHDRKEVAKAIQCSKLVIQMNAVITGNKRVLEGIFCHIPVLIYKVEKEYDESRITDYLAEGEGFWFFDSKRELLEKCDLLLSDKALREEITERGYQKACKTLTTDAVFGHMMDSLKEKLTGEQDMEKDMVNTDSVVLLVGEQDMGKILELERRSDFYQGKMDDGQEGIFMFPFYLYYEKEQFDKFFQHNDINLLRRKDRVVILVGEEELEDYFCQPDVVFPNVIMGDADGNIEQKMSIMISEKQSLLQELATEVYLYYKQNGEAIKKRVAEGTAKICVLKYVYEPPRFQELYRQLKSALEKLEYTVELCEERGAIYKSNEIVQLFEHRPDIVFQINKSRDGRTYQGEEIQLLKSMDNLIFINWIQDIHPKVLDRQYALSLQKKDYIFSIFEQSIMQKYGYPDENVIYGGIMPASKEHFDIHPILEEEHKRFDCDICFVGTITDNDIMEESVCRLLAPYLEKQQIERTWEVIWNLAGGLYDADTSKYITDADILYQCAVGLKEELQCSDTAGMYIYRALRIVRYNALRKLVLEQLAEQKKYRIILYGAFNTKIDGVEYGGFLADRTEIAKALACSKMVLQINPDATINQCVAEGLLSHTPVMVYHVREKDDMSSIAHYLEEQEGFCYFNSKQELTEKCDLLLGDKKLREEIAERGYQKACQMLTADAVFGHLMEELKVKLSM